MYNSYRKIVFEKFFPFDTKAKNNMLVNQNFLDNQSLIKYHLLSLFLVVKFILVDLLSIQELFIQQYLL